MIYVWKCTCGLEVEVTRKLVDIDEPPEAREIHPTFTPKDCGACAPEWENCRHWRSDWKRVPATTTWIRKWSGKKGAW